MNRSIPPLYLLVIITLGAYISLGGQRPPQRCTAIKVPVSTNFPIQIAGKRTIAPQEYSAAFKPIVSLVELPSGFTAVGGGAGFVIACTP